MRRAARRDANHAEVREWFLRLGWTWCDMGSVGDGMPDALVSRNGRTVGVEAKDTAGKLTDAQRGWLMAWPGEVLIVLPCGAETARDRIRRQLPYWSDHHQILCGLAEVIEWSETSVWTRGEMERAKSEAEHAARVLKWGIGVADKNGK